jgi:hypothetical protein
VAGAPSRLSLTPPHELKQNAAAASKNLIRRFKTMHLLPLSVHPNPPKVLSFCHDEGIVIEGGL